VKVECSVIA